jgi:hypothetical protein
MCTLKGFNTRNKKAITYPNLPSAIRPVPNPPKQLHTLEAESSATPNESSEDSECIATLQFQIFCFISFFQNGEIM